MNKRMFLAIGVVLCLIGIVLYKQAGGPTAIPEVSSNPVKPDGKIMGMQAGQQEVYDFIKARMKGPFGVYTNYQDTDQSREVATGHEVLSESASLLMRVHAHSQDRASFDQEWTTAKQTFDLKHGFSYRYSPKLDKRYPLNAAVDDLRIIRALYEAGKAFGDVSYTREADQYGQRFYETNVKNHLLYDFYDETYNITNLFITLCYIDLRTLEQLPVEAQMKQKLLDGMKAVIHNGYLSDSFPFYETRFQYNTNSYTSEKIQMVESLLTILHLAEAGETKPASIAYIKEHVQAGTLYGQYSKEGKPATDVQSTAIYAITAMIGAEISDASLYQDSIRRMNAYQVKDPGSPLNGGFGDTAANQAYSFDNLMALLAYTYDLERR
ncbi:glycosyl hydrolase family 8 [Paenibacillus lutrae]|nr:glycosyl hydrolase family 8 [Paenibacillus lutrae]